MSKSVSKHCSILNYIRHVDPELHELIQDLCIGRIFTPRRGSPGLTFLRPDKDLLAKIKKMAAGDNPGEAVDALHAMVLLDYLPSIEDFADKKSDIPTFQRKKLPVGEVKGSQVSLKSGGGVITPDKNFMARDDRTNIAVYILSGGLVPTDTEPATFSNAKGSSSKKSVKGGGEYKQSRAEMFKRILEETCSANNGRNPSLELLMSILFHFSSNTGKFDTIASLLSNDTLASLAIVLQPYKPSPTYITDNEWQEIVGRFNTLEVPQYCYMENPVAKYQAIMNNARKKYSDSYETIRNLQTNMVNMSAKTNIVDLLKRFCEENKKYLPEGRSNTRVLDLIAEAELRVFSGLLYENSQNKIDINEAISLFQTRCPLDKPYICASANIIKDTNIATYFSSIYLVVRSDALLYLPGIGDTYTSLAEVTNEDALIRVTQGAVQGNDDAYKQISNTMRDQLSWDPSSA